MTSLIGLVKVTLPCATVTPAKDVPSTASIAAKLLRRIMIISIMTVCLFYVVLDMHP
jgi:hypothetical protein